MITPLSIALKRRKKKKRDKTAPLFINHLFSITNSFNTKQYTHPPSKMFTWPCKSVSKWPFLLVLPLFDVILYPKIFERSDSIDILLSSGTSTVLFEWFWAICTAAKTANPLIAFVCSFVCPLHFIYFFSVFKVWTRAKIFTFDEISIIIIPSKRPNDHQRHVYIRLWSRTSSDTSNIPFFPFFNLISLRAISRQFPPRIFQGKNHPRTSFNFSQFIIVNRGSHRFRRVI